MYGAAILVCAVASFVMLLFALVTYPHPEGKPWKDVMAPMLHCLCCPVGSCCHVHFQTVSFPAIIPTLPSLLIDRYRKLLLSPPHFLSRLLTSLPIFPCAPKDWLFLCWLFMWGSWLTAFACAGALGWFVYQSNGQEIYNYATATADMIIVAIGSMYFVAGSYKSNEGEEDSSDDDSENDEEDEEDEEEEGEEEDDEEAKGGRESNRGRTKNAMHQTQSKSTNNNNRNKHNNNNHSDSDSDSDSSSGSDSSSDSDSDASAIEKGNDATTPSAASAAIAAGQG